MGALMIGLGALGGGALPVVANPYVGFPLGSLMGRMMQSSSAVVLVGVGFLVLAWVLMAPYVGVRGWGTVSGHAKSQVSQVMLLRTFITWALPILATAPIFTQDIYSYLAQGSIVAHGGDAYASGPVDVLGPDHPLARSVPLIWAHSPSPYGPVALGIAASISKLTGDSIWLGVIAHRVVALIGIVAVGWALSRLASRCGVNPQAAIWLGVLNPLTMLHLVGGIHNEAIQLGLVMVGMELGLRGIDAVFAARDARGAALLVASGFLISAAGMVKVTGFIALGFIGMGLARALVRRGWRPAVAFLAAVVIQLALLAVTIAAVTLCTGIGIGWVTGQGGAATIRSWMSVTTVVGVAAGLLSMLLGLGDHTNAILSVTRFAGVAVAAAFMVRMLLATFRNRIHPVGGLGVATFVLVILFPVVHPWYMLWAIVPLAAWANRPIFRLSALVYSALLSFAVLPRGLGLPAGTIVAIYAGSLVLFLLFTYGIWRWAKRSGIIR